MAYDRCTAATASSPSPEGARDVLLPNGEHRHEQPGLICIDFGHLCHQAHLEQELLRSGGQSGTTSQTRRSRLKIVFFLFFFLIVFTCRQAFGATWMRIQNVQIRGEWSEWQP